MMERVLQLAVGALAVVAVIQTICWLFVLGFLYVH